MKWDAGKYDRVNIQQFESGMELIALANVRDTDLILDLGCGTGKLTAELACHAKQGHVVGIDPSEEMIGRAREKCASVNNVTLHQMPAQAISFTDAFDLVYSNLALQWVKERHKVAGLIYQSLKAGGRIAVHIPAENFCSRFFKCTEQSIRDSGYERTYRDWQLPWYFPARDEYEIFLKITGFDNVNVVSKEYTLNFDSAGDAADWWTPALIPYMERLTMKEQERVKYAFAMNSEKFNGEKGIEFKLNRLFAFGEK